MTNKNILIVEDDKKIRDLMSEYLGKIATVITAENGQEGLDYFKNNHLDVDLIISDIEMPVMNGLEMIENIRKIDMDIPIYIASAFGGSEMLDKAFDLGVNRFMEKPIKIHELVQYINTDFN